MPLYLDRNFPDLQPDCCPDRIYALVFDAHGQALKDSGGGIYVMLPYLKSAHVQHAIVLSESAERSKYYSLALDNTLFTLPETPMGEKYTVEYWRRPTPGVLNRDQDILEETRDLYWSGLREVESRIDSTQEGRIGGMEVHCVLGYDSALQVVYGIAWLERNHILQTDTTNCTFQWKDYNGSVLTNTTVIATIPDTPGVFRFSQPATDLAPDRLGVLFVSITDAEAAVHTGVSGTNTWD